VPGFSTGRTPGAGYAPMRATRRRVDTHWKGGDENVGWLGDRRWPLLWKIRNWLTRGR